MFEIINPSSKSHLKENETLKSAQEQQLRENLKPDSSEPNQQANRSSSPRDSTASGKGENYELKGSAETF